MLSQRFRRWPNIEPELGGHLIFIGMTIASVTRRLVVGGSPLDGGEREERSLQGPHYDRSSNLSSVQPRISQVAGRLVYSGFESPVYADATTYDSNLRQSAPNCPIIPSLSSCDICFVKASSHLKCKTELGGECLLECFNTRIGSCHNLNKFLNQFPLIIQPDRTEYITVHHISTSVLCQATFEYDYKEASYKRASFEIASVNMTSNLLMKVKLQYISWGAIF